MAVNTCEPMVIPHRDMCQGISCASNNGFIIPTIVKMTTKEDTPPKVKMVVISAMSRIVIQIRAHRVFRWILFRSPASFRAMVFPVPLSPVNLPKIAPNANMMK